MTRGDVHEVRLAGRGHEQRGRRFAAIVQADHLAFTSTVLVVPTSTQARPATFRPEINLGGVNTRLLPEQLRVIDRALLGDRAGTLSFSELRELDDALELVLDL